MDKNYLKLPINFSDILSKQELSTCNIEYSIAQNLFLILITAFGECRFDNTYGCELWDLDFELIYNPNMWKEKVQKSLQNSVELHEKRLLNAKVDLEMGEEELDLGVWDGKRLKQRLAIKITGNLSTTNQPYYFNKNLFLSPISYSD